MWRKSFLIMWGWTFSLLAQYYHPFQNYDDDVDRIKTYSNWFGGNFGICNGDSTKPQIFIDYDTTETRTGHGRSRKIKYGPLNFWSMYVESFDRRWYSRETYVDITNLFPDYTEKEFQGRHIDSVIFYCKLVANAPLRLKLELHDANSPEGSSSYSVKIYPRPQWQRISVALHQFSGNFNPQKAKFLGLTFADYVDPDYQGNHEGILYVDDFYLVEKDYKKPDFGSDNVSFLEYINKVNFRHFWTAVDPVSYFALDRQTWEDLISVDAVGFQLASYVIAHRKGWVEKQKIEDRVAHILDYLLHHCQHAKDTSKVKEEPLKYATVKGNWAHFLDYKTLARKDPPTEFSLFTNALLLSGVLVCREYFNWNPQIVQWADSLYRMTDWNFFYRPSDSLMYYSWTPEKGFSKYYTDWFTEELDLAFLLAISSPDSMDRLPTNPFFASGYRKFLCDLWPTGEYCYSASGANFTYYFLQMYAKYLPPSFVEPFLPFMYRFENAKKALLADLSFCQKNYGYLGYDKRIFGTTACEGPDSAGIGPQGNISNYHAYGYPCRFDQINNPNGTVAVYGSGSAILFIPQEAIACLKYYYDELDTLFWNHYGYGFWSPIFGFPDAFHLAPERCSDPSVNCLRFRGPWLSVPRFGIDIGPMLMNIDSYLSESIYHTPSIRDIFSQNPYVSPHLSEFSKIPVFIDPPVDRVCTSLACPKAFQLSQNYPNPFNPSTVIQYTLQKKGKVELKIYNLTGALVKTLVNEEQNPETYRVIWDGTDEKGRLVPTGIYFYVLRADKNASISRRMILLK